MGKIISAVKGLFEIVQLIFNLITGFLSNLVKLFYYLTKALSNALIFVGTLPSWLQIFGTITISISVMYIILGREGGSK